MARTRLDSPADADLSPRENSPPDTTEAQADTNARVARATGVLALGNIASRILGMAREVVVTNLFGATLAADAYYLATIVPRTLYDLLIAGHVNSAIIPVLSEYRAKQGDDALWRLVAILFSLVTTILAALVLLLTLLAEPTVRLVGSGYDAQTIGLAAHLLRLTSPALLFLGWFSIISGGLYALHRFSLPAFAGVTFNGAIVIVTLLLTPGYQVQTTLSGAIVTWTAARPPDAIQAAALGWLVGSFAQFALQIPGLRRAKLRFDFNWRHPAIRQIAILYAPVMFSLLMDTLIVRTFSYNLASQTGEGSLGVMNWATTLIQFPQGLVATAISIAILPTLAQQAVTHLDDAAPFKNTLGLGLRLAITLIVPATVGLFVLATPIVRLLFEHGEFTPSATAMTTLALRLYLLGLPFAALDLLLVYAFYARQDTLTPALIGFMSLVVYMVVAIVLLPTYGLFSLMIADSVKHLVHALTSAWLLSRKMGGFGSQRLAITLFKTGIAALALGLVAQFGEPVLETIIGTNGTIREAVLVTAIGALSTAAFLAAAMLVRVEELGWLWGMVKARIRRS